MRLTRRSTGRAGTCFQLGERLWRRAGYLVSLGAWPSPECWTCSAAPIALRCDVLQIRLLPAGS